MKNQRGEISTIILIYFAILMTIILLVMAVFMGTVNSLLHQIKTDMYLINRSAIVSVNKNRASKDQFSYYKKDFEKYFKENIKKNYKLNDDLQNQGGIIQKVVIKEYDIYAKNRIDSCTGKKVEDKTIHAVIEVKVKPLILQKQLEKIFTFNVHQDVKIEPFLYKK